MLLPAARSITILATEYAVFLRAFRRRSLAIVCAAIVMALLPCGQLRAQEPTVSDDEVLKVKTDLFVIPIRVKDKRAAAANSITERDLGLKDPDHVTAGLTLYHGADRVAILFALDQSGSLREAVSQQREAALALAGRFGDQSQIAVLRFADKPELVVPFAKDPARDPAAAREAFSFPAQANQHTAIFDAAMAAVKAYSGLPQIRSERRLIILISDGLDNASTIKPLSVIQAAVANHVSFYVIHLPLFQPRDGRLAVRSPAKGFRELAEKTGGQYFLTANASSALAPDANKAIDLSEIFRAIEEDLRSQYLLGWYAGEGTRDGRNHRFTISFPKGVEFQISDFKYRQTQEFFHVASIKPEKAPGVKSNRP
jgi:Ca-activated chloride channel family protein